MTLFVYSIETEFTPKTRNSLNFGLDSLPHTKIYLDGLSPVSKIAAELCRKKKYPYYVFYSIPLELIEKEKGQDKLMKGAESCVIYHSDENTLPNKQQDMVEYLLTISKYKVCIASTPKQSNRLLSKLLEFGGDYLMLPT